MSTDTIQTTVRGYRMEIEFSAHKAERGARDSFNGRPGAGIQLAPDDPGGIDDVSKITLLDPSDIKEIITEEVMISIEDVMEAIYKHVSGYEPDINEKDIPY